MDLRTCHCDRRECTLLFSERSWSVGTNLFIFDGRYELVKLPTYEDLPRSYPVVAGIALRAYEELSEEAPNF